MGAQPWRAGQPLDDESCYQAPGLVTKKKTVGETFRNEEERANWREQVKELDAKRLVVLDACGSNIALTPLYVRAPKGHRTPGSVPRNRGKNTTLLASLSLDGMGASMTTLGAATATAFEAYLEHILVPCCGNQALLDLTLYNKRGNTQAVFPLHEAKK